MKHSIKITLGTAKGELKPIRLRVSFCSQRVDLVTGMSYEESNFVNGKAKNNTKNANRQTAVEVNLMVAQMVEFIDKYFLQCELDHRRPKPDELKNLFAAQFKNATTNADILVVYDQYIKAKEKEKQLAYKSILTLQFIRKTLIEFDKNLTLKRITPTFLNDYKAYLEATNRYKNTSIHVFVFMMKGFLNYLNRNKYINVDFEQRTTIKRITNETQSFLTHQELKNFYNLEPQTPMEQLSKDMFLFACFTGLRFSDLSALRKSDIHPTQLEVVTKKTNKRIFIDLNHYSKELIEKYTADRYAALDTLFPSISLPHYNKILHALFLRCGFDSPVTLTYYKGSKRYETTQKKYEILSSHSARRTFVVECLQKGIAPLVIIRWTGHSNLETLSPYIAIVDNLKRQEMSKFDTPL
ncbi:MAG: tyrosine-type recombinase/integrase [Bacteroidales bacterium]|nr:tyrosine-type recombinase/integrase [Bacteroidales bacterium]